jgi:hypothetical protein
MMDLELDAELERPSNPLDLIERLAALNEWTFDRDRVPSGMWWTFERVA